MYIGGIVLVIVMCLVLFLTKTSFLKTRVVECNQFSFRGKTKKCGQVAKTNIQDRGYKLANDYYLGKFRGVKNVGKKSVIIFRTIINNKNSVDLELLLDLPPKNDGKSIIEDRQGEFYAGSKTKYIAIEPSGLDNYLSMNQEIVVVMNTTEIIDRVEFDELVSTNSMAMKSSLVRCPEVNRFMEKMSTKTDVVDYIR